MDGENKTVIDMDRVFLYKGDKALLEGVNWQVKAGDHWAVLGLNGAGKTSLLNILNGYLLPSRGQVKVLGQTFGRTDLRELRRSLGWVSASLLDRLYPQQTVEDTLISGKFASVGLYETVRDKDRDQAREVMEIMQLRGLASRPLASLSQGEKQQALMGRALMAEPSLLILDEPCGGLDLFNREALLEIIAHMAQATKDLTLLYVTHHSQEILPIFNKALLLRRGQVHSQGPRDQVLSQANMEDFYERPIRYQKDQGRIRIEAG